MRCRLDRSGEDQVTLRPPACRVPHLLGESCSEPAAGTCVRSWCEAGEARRIRYRTQGGAGPLPTLFPGTRLSLSGQQSSNLLLQTPGLWRPQIMMTTATSNLIWARPCKTLSNFISLNPQVNPVLFLLYREGNAGSQTLSQTHG